MHLRIEHDIDCYPAQDPTVIRLCEVLRAARTALEPAASAWRAYGLAHADDPHSVPFSRQKQRLFDRFCDASLDVDEAEAALPPVRAAAIQRATEAWDETIRQEFVTDLPAIEAFIALLARHEATVIEAQLAGVSHVLNVPHTFLTADEVRTRLAYAKQQLGVE